MRGRTFVLVAGCFVVVTGLLILVVPKSVQTGDPMLGQVGGDRTGSYSCGSSLEYAFGNRPWTEHNPETYTGTEFTTISQVCPPLLRSNLAAGSVWVLAGAAILVARWLVVRRRDHQRAVAPQSPGP
jgi:hypothetical protein